MYSKRLHVLWFHSILHKQASYLVNKRGKDLEAKKSFITTIRQTMLASI